MRTALPQQVEFLKPDVVLERWPVMSDGHRTQVGLACNRGTMLRCVVAQTFAGRFLMECKATFIEITDQHIVEDA